MIVIALALAALICGIVGLATGRTPYYGVSITCLAAIPLLGRLL